MDTFVIVLIFILVLIYIGNKAFFSESFENTNEPMKLYIFVSSHCPHCHTYLNNHHKDVCALVKSMGINVQKVQSDGTKDTSDLFNKYGVQYVPAAVIVKGNKVYKNLGSNITPQSVKYALEK
jgi:thiol-disulfide isomerase/thioredoxin